MSLALLITLFSALAQAQCDIAPLTLAWTNTTVTQDGLGVARGVAMGIGSPQQIFALRPSTQLNNTRINNAIDCVSSTNDTCIGGQGGVFNSSLSSTFAATIKGNWNGSQVDAETSTGSFVYINDKVTYQSKASVDGFPFVMDSEPAGGSFSGLPLGTNSSFLDATFLGGAAPSRVFGLWSGSRSLAPVDGLLVVGGYDKSRVSGSFTTFNVSKASKSLPGPLQVNISGLTFGGASLLDDGQILPAIIEPYTQRFIFTSAISQKFGNITEQNPAVYKSGMQYSADSYPSGDLVITLTNGYTSTITNNELFTLLRGSDQYGRYSVTNNTVVEAGIADNRATASKGSTVTLGGLFLTFNYLLVDYMQGNFSLAQAVASSQSTTADIKTICTPSPVVVSTNSTTSAPAATSSAAAATSNAGVIGGAVGGVIGGIALIGGILAFVLIRRRHRRQAEEARHAQQQQDTEQQQQWSDEKSADGQPHFHRQMSELGDGSTYYSGKSPVSASVRHDSEANSMFSPMHWKQDPSELNAEQGVHELPGHYGSAELEAPNTPSKPATPAK